MTVIVAIYVVWISAAVVLWALGASAALMGAMIGGPIGWTIGLLLITGFYRWSRR